MSKSKKSRRNINELRMIQPMISRGESMTKWEQARLARANKRVGRTQQRLLTAPQIHEQIHTHIGSKPINEQVHLLALAVNAQRS